MKKLLAICAAMTAAVFAYAQEDSSELILKHATYYQDNVNVEEGTSTLSFYANYTPESNYDIPFKTGIQWSKYVKDGFAIRLQARLGFSTLSGDDGEYKTNSSDLMGLFGIQKSLIQIRNFSGHAGIDFGVGYGTAKRVYNGEEYGDKQSSFQGEIRPYIGIDWYFVKNFFIGLECGYDFTYISDKLGDSKSTLFSTGLAETNYASVKIGYCF